MKKKTQMTKYRKQTVIVILSVLLSWLQVTGWQISSDYGSLVFQSQIIKEIGVLSPAMYALVLGLGVMVFYVLISALYRFADGRQGACYEVRWYSWMIYAAIIFAVWMVLLWGCYPGFYNYDGGNQLVQVLYDEVPYEAHHPLLHTLIEGGIITLGYRLDSTDLTLGVFLFNVFQMFCCSMALGYVLQYVEQKTKSIIIVVLSVVFYSLFPTIVMFTMSTTKDVLCYAALVVATVHLLKLSEEMKRSEARIGRWLCAGIFLTLSTLMRKNIIYAVVVFAVIAILVIKEERKKQILLFVSVFFACKLINGGLETALHATPGSVNEMLCVPYQQIARLYMEVGEAAFTQEEKQLLERVVPLTALSCYDPAMADYTKANFYPGLNELKENKWEYIGLWLTKGVQYPKVYIDSILYNTYQAWYPGTQIEEIQKIRYFDITSWQYRYGKPHIHGVFELYVKIHLGNYVKWPIVRKLFATGTMMWLTIVAWFYGIWRKDIGVVATYLLILLVCATNFLGPVSDVRYYLQLFYLAPLSVGILLSDKRECSR